MAIQKMKRKIVKIINDESLKIKREVFLTQVTAKAKTQVNNVRVVPDIKLESMSMFLGL